MTVYRIQDNIKYLRKTLSLTGIQFAECISSTRSLVTSWECGHSIPSIEAFQKISNVMMISIDDMVREDLSKIPPVVLEERYHAIQYNLNLGN